MTFPPPRKRSRSCQTNIFCAQPADPHLPSNLARGNPFFTDGQNRQLPGEEEASPVDTAYAYVHVNNNQTNGLLFILGSVYFNTTSIRNLTSAVFQHFGYKNARLIRLHLFFVEELRGTQGRESPCSFVHFAEKTQKTNEVKTFFSFLIDRL